MTAGRASILHSGPAGYGESSTLTLGKTRQCDLDDVVVVTFHSAWSYSHYITVCRELREQHGKGRGGTCSKG